MQVILHALYNGEHSTNLLAEQGCVRNYAREPGAVPTVDISLCVTTTGDMWYAWQQC
jgi:hypothetical protein